MIHDMVTHVLNAQVLVHPPLNPNWPGFMTWSPNLIPSLLSFTLSPSFFFVYMIRNPNYCMLSSMVLSTSFSDFPFLANHNTFIHTSSLHFSLYQRRCFIFGIVAIMLVFPYVCSSILNFNHWLFFGVLTFWLLL